MIFTEREMMNYQSALIDAYDDISEIKIKMEMNKTRLSPSLDGDCAAFLKKHIDLLMAMLEGTIATGEMEIKNLEETKNGWIN